MVYTKSKIIWLLTIMIFFGTVASCQSVVQAPMTGIKLDQPYLIDDFTLTNQFNEEVDSADFRGSFVLVYFGFIHCPDECPTTLSIWKKVYKLLENHAEGVKFVLISVDPVRDTPELLQSYLVNFHPAFIGLTGAVEDIEDIAIDFNVYFREVYLDEVDNNDTEGEQEHDDDYLVAHTTLTFLLHKDGRIILAFPYNTSAEEIVADLERYLD